MNAIQKEAIEHYKYSFKHRQWNLNEVPDNVRAVFITPEMARAMLHAAQADSHPNFAIPKETN